MPSIRLELLRDGLEDYDYLVRLRNVVEMMGSHPELMPRPDVIAALDIAAGLLRVDPSLVDSMRSYSEQPSRFLETRELIAAMIEKLQHMVGQGGS